MRDARIFEWAFSTPWAIEPRKGRVLLAVLDAHSRGLDRATAHGAKEERESRQAARSSAGAPPPNIGVLPLHGVMMPRGNFLNDGSGSLSLEGARAIFRQMLAAPSIEGIVLDIDSPGGNVFGVEEFAAEIRSATKPVWAQAWPQAASGAYYVASAASWFAADPSGMVGSIGVYSAHVDASKFYEDKGLNVTLIQAGKFKTEFADTAPLSEEARTYEQGIVDAYYTKFVRDVAKGRKVSVEKVRSEFGEGRMLMSADALAAGMIDEVATFEQTIQKLARQIAQSKRGVNASADLAQQSPQQPSMAAQASEDLRRRRSRVSVAA